MATNKTTQTDADVQSYLDGIDDEEKRADCDTLARLMKSVTHEPARMWGQAIVGFGSYHYKYASGREGDSCLIGFSPRKDGISIYLAEEFPRRTELLAKLGKHKMSKACLSVRRLSDVDTDVLAKLIQASFLERKSRHTGA